MVEIIKKYTGVTYDLKGVTETEMNHIISALEEYDRRCYRDVFTFQNADTLASRLRKLMK